jgi:hypothetical protein
MKCLEGVPQLRARGEFSALPQYEFPGMRKPLERSCDHTARIGGILRRRFRHSEVLARLEQPQIPNGFRKAASRASDRVTDRFHVGSGQPVLLDKLREQIDIDWSVIGGVHAE